MQILIVTTYGFDPAFPSRPEQLQARALAARGHRLVAYEYLDRRYAGQSRPHEWLAGAAVHRSRTLGFFAPTALLRLLLAERPDVVHIHHMRNLLSFQTTLLARRLGIPTVMTVHGLLHDGDLVADRERPLEAPLRFENLLMTPGALLGRLARGAHPRRATRNYLIHAPVRLVDRLVALSRHEAGLIAQLGVPAERVTVLPNAVELAPFADAAPWLAGPPPGGRPTVLYIGQLVPRKGFDVLARAIPLVARALPDVRFVVAGHNPKGQGKLEQIVAEGGAAANLELRGRVSEEEKLALLAEADVVAAPSRYEGFGIPLIEAMAAARPVVTCDVPACNEIVEEGRHGLIVPYADHGALAAALLRLLGDRPAARAMGAAGREDALARYGAGRLAADLEQLYGAMRGVPT